MNCRLRGAGWIAAVALATGGGCTSVAPLDNPLVVRPATPDPPSTPDAPGGRPGCGGYDEVYERAIDALDDYFEIVPGSRYGRVITTYPKTAPGFEQAWKAGSPDARERWLATFQSVRHFAIVRIDPAESGYRVTVEVYKELETAGVPSVARGGAVAAFQSVPVADASGQTLTGPRTSEGQWVPAGSFPHRDHAFEQEILKKVLRPGGIR